MCIRDRVDTGLGPKLSSGTIGYMEPTETVPARGATLTIDGLAFDFMDAGGTEAPAEFVFYIPAYKALHTTEVVTHNLHNVLTLRGAQVRDALRWSKVIDAMLLKWGGSAEVAMGLHHWPTWGTSEVRTLLTNQRDAYRYVHDRTPVSYTHLDVYKRQQQGRATMADDLIFYTNPMSRGQIVRWMLEEVGAPYQTQIPVSYTHLDVYKRQGIAADGDAGMILHARAEPIGALAFGRPCADRVRDERRPAFQRAGQRIEHARGDVRHARHHEQIADAYAGRARHAVGDQLGALRGCLLYTSRCV